MNFQRLRILYLWIVVICAAVIGMVGVFNFTRAKVVIEWSTANELDTVGFNIYKSETFSEAPELVNSSPIPPSADPLTGGIFTYTDGKVKPDVIYYYYLEDITTKGDTSRYGPIEAQARRGGVLELLAAVCLLAIGLTLYLMMRPKNRKHDPELGNVRVIE